MPAVLFAQRHREEQRAMSAADALEARFRAHQVMNCTALSMAADAKNKERTCQLLEATQRQCLFATSVAFHGWLPGLPMFSKARILKIGIVVGLLSLSGIGVLKFYLARNACYFGPRALEIISALKAANDLTLWKRERCLDLPILHTPPTAFDCTWDDGQLVLSSHLSRQDERISISLQQKVATREAANHFRTVAQLFLDQVRNLNVSTAPLVDQYGLDIALSGGKFFSSKWPRCSVLAGKQERKLFLIIGGSTADGAT